MASRPRGRSNCNYLPRILRSYERNSSARTTGHRPLATSFRTCHNRSPPDTNHETKKTTFAPCFSRPVCRCCTSLCRCAWLWRVARALGARRTGRAFERHHHLRRQSAKRRRRIAPFARAHLSRFRVVETGTGAQNRLHGRRGRFCARRIGCANAVVARLGRSCKRHHARRKIDFDARKRALRRATVAARRARYRGVRLVSPVSLSPRSCACGTARFDFARTSRLGRAPLSIESFLLRPRSRACFARHPLWLVISRIRAQLPHPPSHRARSES